MNLFVLNANMQEHMCIEFMYIVMSNIAIFAMKFVHFVSISL